jgi:predicted TIM-barrel fold metal-dependent hydrolase
MELDLSDIPIVDHHAHPLCRIQPAMLDEWLSFFTESRDPDLVLHHVPHTLFFQYAVQALSGLLGCEASAAAILKGRDLLGIHGWAKLLIESANIKTMLMDYGFRGNESYNHAEMKDLLPCRIEPILRLETVAQELILLQDTFDQFIDAFVAEVENAKANGYVALKSIIAYRTGLDIREWSRDEVESAFIQVKEQARRDGKIRLASPPINDLLVLKALEIANRQGMPIQFHTGYGDSDVNLLLANPLHFRPWLQSGKFSRVPWVILHMGYPYLRESAYLASIYPNIFVDLSLAIPFAVGDSQSMLIQLLGLAPTSKLLYASDGFSIPELFWLGAKVCRTYLGRVLDQLVTDNILTAGKAYASAEQILFHNNEQLYDLEKELSVP